MSNPYVTGSWLRPRRSLDKRLRAAVLERDGWKCRKCSHESLDGSELEVHHKHERADGGTDTLANLDTLCMMCHSEWSFFWTQPRAVTYERWLTMRPAYAVMRLLLWGADNVGDKGLSKISISDQCNLMLFGLT